MVGKGMGQMMVGVEMLMEMMMVMVTEMIG